VVAPDFKQGLYVEQTEGDYQTEEMACIAFDDAVTKTGLFNISKEVWGRFNNPLPFKDNKDHPRIDRILTPTTKLLDAGWNQGAVGVEIKKSGVKLGRPLSQCMDYLHIAWEMPRSKIVVNLNYVFLFPLGKFGNSLASLCEQNHLGGCLLQYGQDSPYHRLAFFTGEHVVLEYRLNTGELKIGKTIGKRTGSR
jgi:hypothetical protein